MISGSAELDTVLKFAPEWEQLLRNFRADGASGVCEFLNRVGAKALYRKAAALNDARAQFVELLQRQYYQPMLSKMLTSNQNLRRFLSQRRVTSEDLRGQIVSMSVDLSVKLAGNLSKQLSAGEDDGFKVLLPAYVQRSVHNAVIDFIRQESTWERQTLQDVYLDPQQDDPRSTVADDLAYTPEHKALSREQVTQLNELRRNLQSMLSDGKTQKEPLIVVDCMFGLGLTEHSKAGQELTMRECCDVLKIEAETLARRIARCQVLLDKGLEMVRQKIYNDMPGIAEAWQRGLNINMASRRELTQQLGMTEGEVDRCIKCRQYTCVDDVIERRVIKPERLPELIKKGLVAAFVPVDLNSATNRDIVDIVGASKETAARIVSERPFKDINELVARKIATGEELAALITRGAVVRNKAADSKRLDLNKVGANELVQSGVDDSTANMIVKLRPFMTWSEVEELLGAELPCWQLLRQKFFLGISSA